MISFVKNGSPTPYFETTFWLLQNIRLIHVMIYAMICVYTADDMREYITVELVMSFHQFVQQALKYLVTIEQIGNSSFI